MTIVVTGATGLLGRQVCTILQENGHEIIGTGFSRCSGSIIKLDLTDFEKVKEFMTIHKPEWVIHCAAEKRPDVAAKNEEATLQLNVGSCRELAKLSKSIGFQLVYISTDYVFDGSQPPYEVDNVPNPLNFYGQSKLQGEIAIKQETPRAIILRVPILYGPVLQNSESAVNILVDVVLDSKPVVLDHFQSRFPTNVIDVAKTIHEIIKKCKPTPLSGTFHFSAKERLTKFQMCQIIAGALNRSMDHITPNPNPPKEPIATRPNDCQLSTKRLESVGINIGCISFENWFHSCFTKK